MLMSCIQDSGRSYSTENDDKKELRLEIQNKIENKLSSGLECVGAFAEGLKKSAETDFVAAETTNLSMKLLFPYKCIKYTWK